MKGNAGMVELMVALAIIALAVGGSMAQTIVYWLNTPPGSQYLFAHNYIEDYYDYLHTMRQGWEGLWLATSRFNPEVYPGQLVKTWLVFSGHVARIAGITLPVLYTLERVVGAVLLLLLSYLLIRKIYDSPVKRLTALFLVSFSTFWWTIGPTGVGMPWLVRAWTELDPLFRGSYIPHHLWSKVFFLVVLLLLTAKSHGSWVRMLGAAAATVVMGFASPVILVVLVGLIFLWGVLELIREKTIRRSAVWSLAPALLIVVAAVVVALHHRQVQYSVPPWTGSYIGWENTMRYPITVGAFLQSLGPTFLLFFLAIPWLYRTSRMTRLLLAWVGAGFILLFGVGALIPLSNTRYLTGYYFIPLGIGATEGVWIIGKAIPRSLGFVMLALLIYFSIGLGVTWRVHANYIRQNQLNPQVYVSNDLVRAVSFLDTVSPPTVVLARYWVSTMIPAFTSHRVVAGHALMSVDNETRKGEIERFFQRRFSPKQAKDWLAAYGVGLIIEEDSGEAAQRYYQVLGFRQIFTTPTVAIYGSTTD